MDENIRELPEFQDAFAWRAGVFAMAESIIAEETFDIPDGVLARMERLVSEGALGAEDLAIARAWSGVAPGTGLGSTAISRALASLACAPGEGDDLTAWWLNQSTGGMGDAEIMRFDSAARAAYGRREDSPPLPRSVVALGACEKAIGADAARHLPTIPELFDLLNADGELDDDARVNGRLLLGFVSERVNEIRRQCRAAGVEGPEFERVSVIEVSWALGAAGREFYSDCGAITDPEEFRDVIAVLESDGLEPAYCFSCARPGGVIWLAADRAARPFGLYRCGGCGREDANEAYASRGQGVDAGASAVKSAALGLAIALRVSPVSAAALLADEDGAERFGERCPRAEECNTACGAFQRMDADMVASAGSGVPDECEVKEFLDEAEGVDDYALRREIAKRVRARRKGDSVDEGAINAEKAPEAVASAQGLLL